MAEGEGGSFRPHHRSSKKAAGRAHLWFQRNESKLLATDIVCIILLFFLQLFPSTFQFLVQENVNAIQIAALMLVSPIALSVVWKGIVPIVICVLGIVLIHNSVLGYFLPG